MIRGTLQWVVSPTYIFLWLVFQPNTLDEANVAATSPNSHFPDERSANSGTQRPDGAPLTLPGTDDSLASSMVPGVGSAPPGPPSSTSIPTPEQEPNSHLRLSSFQTSTPADRLSDLDTTCVWYVQFSPSESDFVYPKRGICFVGHPRSDFVHALWLGL